MDQKTEVMVSLGAAIGANCIPCFNYIYAKAKESDLEDADIRKSVEVAFKVKNGAQIFMKNAESFIPSHQQRRPAILSTLYNLP